MASSVAGTIPTAGHVTRETNLCVVNSIVKSGLRYLFEEWSFLCDRDGD